MKRSERPDLTGILPGEDASRGEDLTRLHGYPFLCLDCRDWHRKGFCPGLPIWSPTGDGVWINRLPDGHPDSLQLLVSPAGEEMRMPMTISMRDLIVVIEALKFRNRLEGNPDYATATKAAELRDRITPTGPKRPAVRKAR